MEEKQRNKVGYYYSIIPSKILYNKELKANEKLFICNDKFVCKLDLEIL